MHEAERCHRAALDRLERAGRAYFLGTSGDYAAQREEYRAALQAEHDAREQLAAANAEADAAHPHARTR